MIFAVLFGKIGSVSRCASAKQLLRYDNLTVFKMADVRHLGSCCRPTRLWTAHEKYSVFFIIAQNLIGIDETMSIMCNFNILPLWLAYSRHL